MNRLLPLAAFVLLSSAGPAQAGLFDDAEARNQIIELRKEFEGRLENTSRGQLELANQNEQLRAEVALLETQLRELEAVRDERMAAVALEIAQGRLSRNSTVVTQ